jgi:hypothetical protein
MDKYQSKLMLRDALALILAVRCQQKEACLQLLARFYQQMSEQQAKIFMIRTIYLLSPPERDWLRSLA